MKKIVKLLSVFLLSLCIFTFFANPVISAEEDEEYTELEYYYNDNKTKVKIPAQKPNARHVLSVPGFPLPCFVISSFLDFATVLAELKFPTKYEIIAKIT